MITIAWCMNCLTGGDISVVTDDTHWLQLVLLRIYKVK